MTCLSNYQNYNFLPFFTKYYHKLLKTFLLKNKIHPCQLIFNMLQNGRKEWQYLF